MSKSRPTAADAANQKKLLEQAEKLLAEWPERLALAPETKPLSTAWLPRTSPFSGRRGPARKYGAWWEWKQSEPDRLRDLTTGRRLPDAFPYRNVAAMYRYQASIGRMWSAQALAEAYRATGDARFARAVLDLIRRLGEVMPGYPVTRETDANPERLITYGPEARGTFYNIKVNVGWVDTLTLQILLRAYRLVRDCPKLKAADHRAVAGLAREIIEFQSLPTFLYLLDKFHNSLTNHLEAFILAAQLLGPDFQVRDTQSGTVYSGPDLAQLAVNSPKGVRMFITHAYDRNGIYWEMSASYTGYTLNFFEHILTALTGYSDPPGYRPGPGVRDFYQPLRDFNPGRELPEFWRALLAQPRLSMNSGECLPVNDARAGAVSSQHLELWAKLLGSERIARAAAGVKRFEGQPAPGPADPWPPAGSTLMPAAGQATLRGPENRLNLHCDWHPMSDYHSHHDPLNLILSAEKHLLLFDLGYHLGHPLRSMVTDRTAAHNTVTVDRADSVHHRKGVLHHYLGDGPVQFLDASVPEAYPQCDRYRRALVMVGDRYLVDIFRVRGGTRHDYTLLSYATESRGSLPLKDYPGSLADLRKRYRGYRDLEDDFPNVAGPYQLIHRPRIGAGRENFTVDWPHKGRPDLSLRVHHLNGRGTEVMLARVPFRLRYQGNLETTSEMLIVSRAGRPGLASTFISVLEPRSGASRPLAGARRLPLESPDPDAVAVRVETGSGYDLIINGLTDGPHRLAEEGLTLHGKLAVLRRRTGRPGFEVTLYGNRLEGPGLRLAAPPVRSGRVTGIDLAGGELTLDEPLPGAARLAGRFILVRGRTGETDRWLVRSAEGRKIRLDLDHSRLLVMEGRVEKVIDRMAFLTGIDFPEPPRPGTPVRFGPVGDFNCPRHHLLMTSQSGNPTRYRLTTCFEPRRHLFGFNRNADLKSEFEGRPFWSSAIEIGDDIFTEPYLHREVAGKRP